MGLIWICLIYSIRRDFAAFLSSDVNSTTVIQAFSTASGPPTRTFDANQTKPKTKNKKKRKPAQIFQENSDCLVPARIPLPRVLKSDIRRQYGTMFANVFNTGEYDFMWNFLDTFVRPDDLYIMRKVGKCLCFPFNPFFLLSLTVCYYFSNLRYSRSNCNNCRQTKVSRVLVPTHA